VELLAKFEILVDAIWQFWLRWKVVFRDLEHPQAPRRLDLVEQNLAHLLNMMERVGLGLKKCVRCKKYPVVCPE